MSPKPMEQSEILSFGSLSALERKFLEEYLAGKELSLAELKKLPEAEAQTLMKEASRYASLKLAEIESRAHLKDEIHLPD